MTESLEFSGDIMNTIREPLIILDGDFKVVSASRSFYEVFKVTPEETVGNLIYDLGNKQWDIPRLRELLETILPEKTTFDNYEVEHDFTSIGRRIMLLNARQVQRAAGKERFVLLAIEDITERKKAERKIEYLSFHDSLTGLCNRRLMEVEMKRLDTERQMPISMIMCDLDGLKKVNDLQGHAAGDELIAKSAEVIKNSCRSEDIIARWGGDEFLIMLPQTSRREAEKIAERVKASSAAAGQKNIPLPISMGVATKENAETNIYKVIGHADELMYAEKREGNKGPG